MLNVLDVFYDKDNFFALVEDGAELTIYCQNTNHLWLPGNFPEGLYVNNELHHKQYIQIQEGQLYKVVIGNVANESILNHFLAQKKLSPKMLSKEISSRINDLEITRRDDCPDSETVLAELKKQFAQEEQERKEEQERQAKQNKLNKLILNDLNNLSPFEVFIKETVLVKLSALLNYEAEDIIFIIEQILLNQVPTVDDERWVVIYDLKSLMWDYLEISKILAKFPNKTIHDYQEALEKCLKMSAQRLGNEIKVDVPYSQLFRSYTAHDYWLHCLQLKTGRLDEKQIGFLNEDIFTEKLIDCLFNIDFIEKLFFIEKIAQEIKISNEAVFETHKASWNRIGIQDYHLTFFKLYKPLIQLSQDFKKTTHESYLAVFINWIYRICLYIDTYCLRFSLAGKLLTQLEKSSLQTEGLFKHYLTLNSELSFEKEMGRYIRNSILGKN